MGLSPKFLNTGTTDNTFQQCRKQDSFRLLIKSSANSISIQAHSSLEPPVESKQDQMPLDESKLAIIFLTNLGVTGISCSFKLVPEGKPGKKIPETSRRQHLMAII